MKRAFCFLLLAFFYEAVYSQEQFTNPIRSNIKWSPSSLYMGSISAMGEFSLNNKHSLTLKVGVPLPINHDIIFYERKGTFSMECFSAMVGYRSYFGNESLKGFYLEPYFKFLSHTSKGGGNLIGEVDLYRFTNKYQGAGVGMVVGKQYLVKKRWVIDWFIGPEINSSAISFKSAETKENDPWDHTKGKNIEKDTRSFINSFPFMKDRFEVLVDNEQRRVNAQFLGMLPGLRAGIAFGIAF